MKALNRNLKLADSIATIQTNAEGVLKELRVTDEILKYLPEIKEELDEVEKNCRGERFKGIINRCVEEIRTELNKVKEMERQYDIKSE